MALNRLELRDLAERLFTIACNYPPFEHSRSYKVPQDERRLRDMEEILMEALDGCESTRG